MEFRTIVQIAKPGFAIQPRERVLLVGSCFADGIGSRFREEGFPVTVNPFGTMYNPVSVLHTVSRLYADGSTKGEVPSTVFLTLGTNHVYRLKETGEIVDNCQKRPQHLFHEEVLRVDACADYLQQTVDVLRRVNPAVRVVLTVSPIRYRKYGYHESQLSKATLLLAVDQLLNAPSSSPASRLSASPLYYFPAYELLMDELRDYRFYAADMLHPSDQAVDYIWERLVESCFSAAAKSYLDEWRPLKQFLAHKPFHPEAAEYQARHAEVLRQVKQLHQKYPVNGSEQLL